MRRDVWNTASGSASLLEDALLLVAVVGGGGDSKGGWFLAFLEHCSLLMNENLMQPVRGPIVADFS